MARYLYTSANEEYELPLPAYEAKLLSLADREISIVGRVLVTIRKGVEEEAACSVVLAGASTLLAALEPANDLLQYSYGLRVGLVGERSARYIGSVDEVRQFRGRTAMVTAGPGHCDIYYHDVITQYGMTTMKFEKAHDLRDMQPVTIDDGVWMQAKRKDHPVSIVAKIRSLVQFLQDAKSKRVVVRYD